MPINMTPECDTEWSDVSNCYAYACNDRKPANGYFGGAIPGSLAGVPAYPGPDYHNRLIQGAIADGLKHLPQYDLSNLPMPKSGCYLVLLLADQNGFHWMRHDPILDRWSWKSGNSGDVYYSAFNIQINYCMYIKMANLSSALTTERKNFIWNTHMQFVAFFEVPQQGIVVSSPKNRRKNTSIQRDV